MVKIPVFNGSRTAIVTPFSEHGVDYERLKKNLEFQYENGTSAIVVCGTTGENATHTPNENDELVRVTVRTVNGRMKVIAGIGSNNTENALRAAENAKYSGADAVLMVTPYYNKTTQQGLLRHYLFLAEGVELPMLLYNVPSRTGMSFRAETYAALAEHPNIYGVKEASGDFGLILRTRALCPEDFALYSGNDDQIVPILALGGLGVISTAANVVPAELHALCDSFFRGDLSEARAIQLRLQPLIQALFLEVNPIPVKAALAAMGRMEETVRMPLTTLGPAARRALEQAMDGLSLR